MCDDRRASPLRRRRYERGWRNFKSVYKAIVDSWVLYDNSGDQPVLLDTGGRR